MQRTGNAGVWLLPIVILAVFWLGVAWLHLGSVGRPDVDPIRAAERLPLDPLGPATRTALPDDWSWTAPGLRTARYRIPIELADLSQVAIYLHGVNARARVIVNAVLVDEGDSVRLPTTHYWHVPQLVPVPPSLWREGVNEIGIELSHELPGRGYLGPVYVAPESTLSGAYRTRQLLQVTGIEILVVGMMLLAVFLVLVWLRRRQEPAYLWFGITTALFAFGFLHLFTPQTWLPETSWSFVWLTLLNWLVVVTFILMHRLLGIDRPRLERFAIALSVAATSFFLIAEGTEVGRAAMLPWTLVVLAAGPYAPSLVALELMRRPRRELQILVACPLLVMSAGNHDMLVGFGPWPLHHDMVIQWSALASAVLYAWILVSRFIDALSTSEALTAELEDRVARKAAELEANHARLRHLEEERAVTRERERLMAEIHDGMGGQLVSTLAMIRTGEAPIGEVEDALRAALDDMRLVIHSLEEDAADVPALLGMLRARLGPQLERAGIRVRWAVEDLPPLPDFGPEKALHLMRIVQEAITNVVKHADATTLTVAAGVEPGEGEARAFVLLADDGRGFGDATPRSGEGRGLANMRRRAETLGAELLLRSTESGTEVRLLLPL